MTSLKVGKMDQETGVANSDCSMHIKLHFNDVLKQF